MAFAIGCDDNNDEPATPQQPIQDDSCKDGKVKCGDKCIDPKTSDEFCGADENCENYEACESPMACTKGKCEEQAVVTECKENEHAHEDGC